MSSTEVAQLKETLDDHWEALQSITKTQDKMMDLLQGNPINKSDSGLLGRIEVTERKVSVLESQRNKAIWIGVGVGSVVTLAWTIVQVFIK